MDYYSILGVDRNADQEQIKRAYRNLVKQHHPDQGGDSEQFKRINEAYETLSNASKRQQYDTPRPQFEFDTSSFSGHPFEDIFASIFRQQRKQMRNKDIRIRVDIDLKECLTGKSLLVSYKLGNGETSDVTIEIPAGINSGDSIRFQGLGDNTVKELPRGDLHAIVNVKNSLDFTRNGNDLTTIKSVNVLDLLTGCAIIINTVEGKTLSLNIAQGTNPETTFSMKGFGIPDINSGIRGNLYVKIKAFVPKINNNLIIEQIEKIKKQLKIED
jgi:DnaJ-class molecular chaperone